VFQSEIATRLALDHMLSSTDFDVTFHPERKISIIHFAKDNTIEAVETADGVTVAEGGAFVFAAGNMVQLLETSQMRDSIPMMGICGVTQNIDPGLEFWKNKKMPQRPIKSVTAGHVGGITKCLITPDFLYEQHDDGSIKRGDDARPILKSMYTLTLQNLT
jgi:hypothetical protein